MDHTLQISKHIMKIRINFPGKVVLAGDRSVDIEIDSNRHRIPELTSSFEPDDRRAHETALRAAQETYLENILPSMLADLVEVTVLQA